MFCFEFAVYLHSVKKAYIALPFVQKRLVYLHSHSVLCIQDTR